MVQSQRPTATKQRTQATRARLRGEAKAPLTRLRLRHSEGPATGLAGRGPAVRDAHEIADDLASREIKLNIGGSVHDPTDPMGKLLFNVLAMIAEFEADLISMRTREGMKIAKAKGRLRGKQPKLSVKQETHLVKLHTAGEHTMSELAELFSVGRSTVYRAIERAERKKIDAITP